MTEYVTVKHRGLTCYADTFRHTSNDTLVLASLYGPRNAVRGIWASMVTSKHGASVSFGGKSLRCDLSPYTSVQAPLPGGAVHLLVMWTGATRASAVDGQFAVVGWIDGWWQRFRRACDIPLKDSWAPTMLQLGKDHGLIYDLRGIGTPARAVKCHASVWGDIIKDAVQTGVLS